MITLKFRTILIIWILIFLLALISYLGYQVFKTKAVTPIILTYQYFDGCPSADTLRLNVKSAMNELKGQAELVEVVINTDELARKYKFRGSPTLLINGKDFENMAEPINASLSCRIYANGVPSAEVIKDSILKNVK